MGAKNWAYLLTQMVLALLAVAGLGIAFLGLLGVSSTEPGGRQEVEQYMRMIAFGGGFGFLAGALGAWLELYYQSLE